jgi:hypothetical protein
MIFLVKKELKMSCLVKNLLPQLFGDHDDRNRDTVK